MPNDNDNLTEAEEMLREIGAENTWIIQDATHTMLTFVFGGAQMMLPIADGTLLVAYFPPITPPTAGPGIIT